MKLVISGGRVVVANAPKGEAPDIVVVDEKIADIVAPDSVTDADMQRLDASHRLIIPGLINAHTHSHGGLSKDVGDRWSLEILQTANPWLGGHRSEEDDACRRAARYRCAALRCARSGGSAVVHLVSGVADTAGRVHVHDVREIDDFHTGALPFAIRLLLQRDRSCTESLVAAAPHRSGRSPDLGRYG
jgi:cytosine/adenosine deaminase-related metal-dependent hydrolase